MHLLEGTQKENMQDAYERNRKHHKNALKRNVVEQIFRLKLTGMLNKDIANQLNVSRQVVSKYLDFQKTTPLDWKNRLDQLRWN
jgi:DNA-binding NarL/FixJ family response regulator